MTQIRNYEDLYKYFCATENMINLFIVFLASSFSGHFWWRITVESQNPTWQNKQRSRIVFSDLIQPEQPTCTHCNSQTSLVTKLPLKKKTHQNKKKSYTSVKYVQSVKFPVKSPKSILPIRPALCWVTVGSPSTLNSQQQQQPADVHTHAEACKAGEQRGIRVAQTRETESSACPLS